jgi:gamma-tubulin complex component 5
LGDLEFLKPPELHIEPILKWRDLVKEDPLLRDKIWKNIDYTAESSEDEGFSDSDVEHSVVTETTQSSLNKDVRRPQDPALPIDWEGLKRLQKEQFWKNIKEKPNNIVDAYFETPKSVSVTELQAIRETLFMLRGLSTSLYSVDNSVATQREKGPAQWNEYYECGTIRPVSGFTLSGVSSQVFYDTLSRLSSYGTSFRNLRTWIPIDKTEPLMQRIQQQIQRRLQEFDELLFEMEGKYVAPKSDVVISIAEIQTAVTSHIEPFQALAKLVRENHKWVAYRWLEALYDSTCTAQMAGNDEIYEILGTMFFECFDIYLRPLRRWMEDGDLASGFFIKRSQQDADSISLWENYIIEKDKNGAPKQTPRFLHTAAQKIFTSGKSVVILKQLGSSASMRCSWTYKEPTLDLQTVCDSQEA